MYCPVHVRWMEPLLNCHLAISKEKESKVCKIIWVSSCIHTADVTRFRFKDRISTEYRYTNRSKLTVRQRILATAEAIAIKLFKPTLCSQKKFVKALKLPWPDTQTSPDSTQRPGDE